MTEHDWPVDEHGFRKPMGGPRLRLTDDLIEKIAQLIKVGNYASVACRATGVNEDTYYAWGRRGLEMEQHYKDIYEDDELRDAMQRDGRTRYDYQCIRFLRSIEKADAEQEAHLVTIVRAAAPQHWQAAMTMLERRAAQRWRKRSSVTVDDDTTETQNMDERALLDDPEAVAHMHEALKQVSKGSTVEPVDAEVVDPEM